jgi:hypothetical protein
VSVTNTDVTPDLSMSSMSASKALIPQATSDTSVPSPGLATFRRQNRDLVFADDEDDVFASGEAVDRKSSVEGRISSASTESTTSDGSPPGIPKQ